MKIRTAAACEETTGTASTIGRQLLLAAFAVIWLLSGGFDKTTHPRVHLGLVLGAALLAAVVSGLSDYFQYVLNSRVFRRFVENSKKKAKLSGALTDEMPEKWDDYEAPGDPELRWIWFLFRTKVIALGVTYALVGVAVLQRAKF